MSERRIFGLDVLRFIAISFVVFGHALYFFPSLMFLESLFVFGVEIFFVLSGFLIGGILLKGFEKSITKKSLRTFWVRRWFRTLPNYFLFLCLNFLAFSLLKDGYEWNYQYLFFMQNLLWLPDGFFSVSWSLAVEEWFYIVFPVLVMAVYRMSGSLTGAFLIAALSLLVSVIAARFYGAYFFGWSWNEELRFIVALRLDSLMFGVLAAYAARYHSAFVNKWVVQMAMLGGALFVVSVYINSELRLSNTPFFAVIQFPLVSLSVALTLPAAQRWMVSETIGSAFVTKVSVWSYSLYLVHIPLLEFVQIVVSKYIYIYDSSISWAVVTIWIAVSVFCSAFLYHFFERPTTQLRERWS